MCILRRKIHFPCNHLVKEKEYSKIKCIADTFVVALQNKNFQRRCEFDSIGSSRHSISDFGERVAIYKYGDREKTPFLVPVFVNIPFFYFSTVMKERCNK